MSIINPADCEVHLVVLFLNAKNICSAKIHHQLVEVYGKSVMNEGNVHKWCWEGHMCDLYAHLVIIKDLKDRIDAS
jgi:hypothetical protein